MNCSSDNRWVQLCSIQIVLWIWYTSIICNDTNQSSNWLLLILSTYFYHKVTDRLWVSELFLPMLNYFFFAFENIFYWNVKCIWSWIFGKIMKFLWSQATLFSKSVGISTLFSLPFPITIIAYSPVVHVHLFPMTTEFLHLRHPAQHSQHLQFCFCVSSACCLIAGGVRTRWRMICWYW